MSDEELFKRTLDWEAKFNEKEKERDYSRYDALCALYLDATPEQRSRLPYILAPEDTAAYENRIGGLIVYMRWNAKRIKTPEDAYPLRLGLAAAAILEERLDSRDIGTSLAFLYHAAKQVGLDPVPHFIEIADMARPQTRQFILQFLDWSEADIESTVAAYSGYLNAQNLPYKEIELN
ncbi:MAG: hypothetical protein ABIO92_01735 [Chloroflexia bacterium]